MEKVISLNDKREYTKEVAKITTLLGDMENELESHMFRLLTKGNWKEWLDNQPEGTTIQFTHEMFGNAGDENVHLLIELICKMLEVRNLLQDSGT